MPLHIVRALTILWDLIEENSVTVLFSHIVKMWRVDDTNNNLMKNNFSEFSDLFMLAKRFSLHFFPQTIYLQNLVWRVVSICRTENTHPHKNGSWHQSSSRISFRLYFVVVSVRGLKMKHWRELFWYSRGYFFSVTVDHGNRRAFNVQYTKIKWTLNRNKLCIIR